MSSKSDVRELVRKASASGAKATEASSLEDIAEVLDRCAKVLSSRGLALAAHFLEMANLDLKCRISGVSEQELASMALLARHVFERKWAARRVVKPELGDEA